MYICDSKKAAKMLDKSSLNLRFQCKLLEILIHQFFDHTITDSLQDIEHSIFLLLFLKHSHI